MTNKKRKDAEEAVLSAFSVLVTRGSCAENQLFAMRAMQLVSAVVTRVNLQRGTTDPASLLSESMLAWTLAVQFSHEFAAQEFRNNDPEAAAVFQRTAEHARELVRLASSAQALLDASPKGSA